MDDLPSDPSAPAAFHLIQACQAAVGYLRASRWPDFKAVESLLHGVPRAQTYGDGLVASAALDRFIRRAGVELHRRFHCCVDDDTEKRIRCDFDPRDYEVSSVVHSWDPAAWSPASAFATWARRYSGAFASHHPEALTERARQLLECRAQNPMSVRELAHELGCSVRVLQREFTRRTGEPVSRYVMRLRVRTAFKLLLETDWKVESLARVVGWRSKKNLYAALRRTLQLTPAQVRGLREPRISSFLSILQTSDPTIPRDRGIASSVSLLDADRNHLTEEAAHHYAVGIDD